MEGQCPNCGQTVSTGGKGQYCPFCGASLATAAEPETPPATEPPSYSCPWENREKIGFFKALIDTWTQSVFHPTEFFSRMPPEGGLGGPLLYGFIMSEIGLLMALMWQGMSILVPSFLEESRFGETGAGMVGLTFLYFVSPFLVIAGLFISAAILHLCLLIVGGAHRSFEATFRVVCYSSGTQLFSVAPFCGGIVGGIWNLVLQVIGLSETHKASRGQAALAVLLPVIICCGFGFLALMGLISQLR